MQPWRVTTVLLLLGACSVAPLAWAIEPVPGTPGWRGFVILGAGYLDIESNLIAGNRLIDIGDATITNVSNGPERDDTFHPLVTGEVNYTFGNRWQAFLGTSLEDAVTLDAVAQLGLRKDLGDTGIVQGGILFSGVPTEVWEDPYLEGVARDETDRDSTGVRVQWDRILGSAFELTFSYRDVSVDTERSGEGVSSVTCLAACRELLRRDGDQYFWDLSYLFRLGDGQSHLLRPKVRYVIDDRDGAAISSDAYQLQLSYVFLGQGYNVATNLVVGSSSFDRLAVDTTLLYRLPTASGRWQALATVLWGDENSDVAFNDGSVVQIGIGAMYRFGDR
jgi:Protein of unknown function (DUF2860)